MGEGRDDDSVVTVVSSTPAELAAAVDHSVVTVVSDLSATLAAQDATVSDAKRDADAQRDVSVSDAIPKAPIPHHAAVSASVLAPPLRSAPLLPTAPKIIPDVETAITYTALDDETFTAAVPPSRIADASGVVTRALTPPPVLPVDAAPVDAAPVDAAPVIAAPVAVVETTLRIEKRPAQEAMGVAPTSTRRRMGAIGALVGAVIIALMLVVVALVRDPQPSARASRAPAPRVDHKPAAAVVESRPEPAPLATDTKPPPARAPATARVSKKRPAKESTSDATRESMRDPAGEAAPKKKQGSWDPDALFPD